MIKVLLTILTVVALALAAAPSDRASAANYEYRLDSTVFSSVGGDTVAGATDTVYIGDYFTYKPRTEVILGFGPFLGGGADSVKLAVNLFCYDASKNQIAVVNADTLTDSIGRFIAIPAGLTSFGYYFRIVYQSYTANGGKVALGRTYRYLRRVVGIDKGWD